MIINLETIKVIFTLTALDTISLPPYKGSAIRGGFGHAFRKVVCAVRKKTCDDCLLEHRCAYSYVFETPPPTDAEMMSKYPRAPHPFVIEPPDGDKQVYQPGETLEFSLVLIGRGCDYLAYFVYAFEELGNMGLGRGKGKYRIDKVRSGEEVIYIADTRTLREPVRSTTRVSQGEPAKGLSLSFLTPTRIKYEEQLAPAPEFHMLIRNLLRRISSLSYFHGGEKLEVDYKGLIERSAKVQAVKKDVRWIDWERYSSRQDERMMLGGFIGEMEFEGDVTEFLPFLRFGELVHIGKATSFGLGKFKIRETIPS